MAQNDNSLELQNVIQTTLSDTSKIVILKNTLDTLPNSNGELDVDNAADVDKL